MHVIFGKGKVGKGVDHLLSLLNIPHILMDDEDLDEAKLTEAEQIIISPGIKLKHMLYQKYEAKIVSELNFLGSLLPTLAFAENIEYIGITATNGKSTTTWMTYNLFKGFLQDKIVHISGNFETPLSETLAYIIENNLTQEKHVIIVECSSFMLYQLKNFWFDYGVVLNIATDHLDRHKDFEDYAQSKLNILKYTKKSAFTNPELYSQLSEKLKSHVQVYQPVHTLEGTQFVGLHNQQNVGAVKSILAAYIHDHGYVKDEGKIQEIIQEIPPLDHRLRLLKIIGDIKIYDDGICTSSQALHAALTSFDEKVLLICGGYDKGDNYQWLSEFFGQKVGYCVAMGQTADTFADLCEKNTIPYKILPTLHEVIQTAYQKAKENNIKTILFSPGAASFDMFKNVYDRAEQFLAEVDQL